MKLSKTDTKLTEIVKKLLPEFDRVKLKDEQEAEMVRLRLH